MQEATRYLRRRHRKPNSADERFDGTIQVQGDPANAAAFGEAMKARLAELGPTITIDQVRAISVELAPKFDVTLGQETQASKLPEPWRTYLTTELHAAYVTGFLGDRGFIGTNTWMLFCPSDIVLLATEFGFRTLDLAAGAFDRPRTGPFPLELPEPGLEDDAVVDVGGQMFARSTLAPLVLQGAIEGYLMSNGRLLCPDIGSAIAMHVGRRG